MRTLILSGRLAANAEQKTSKNGRQYLEFRMGNNEYRSGENSETYWFRVTSFNPNHMKLLPYLTKGRTIEVIGDLSASPYMSTTTGKPEAGLEVLANDIKFDGNFSKVTDTQNTETPTAEQPKVEVKTEPAKPKKAATRNPSTAPIEAPKPAPQAVADSDEDDLPF